MSASPAPAATGPKFQIPYPNKEVEDLLLWRDIKKSGTVFGAATLVYLLFEWSGIKPIALLAYLLMIAVMGCFLWQHGSSLVGRAGPPIPKALTEGLTEEQFRSSSDKFRVQINSVLAIAGRLVSGKDLPLTLKVTGGLYAIGWLSQRVSLLAAAYFVLLLAFTLPKVYELKYAQIDKVVTTLMEKASQVYEKVNEAVLKKIPAAKKEQ